MKTVLFTSAIVLLLGALAMMTLRYRKQLAMYTKLVKANDTLLDNSGDLARKVYQYRSACNNPRSPWVVRQYGREVLVMSEPFKGTILDGEIIVAKRYRITDSRDYALRCAEELAEKLNENI